MAKDIYTPYERGLALFKQRLAPAHVRYSDFLVFEHRLNENIDKGRLYGDTPEISSDRVQIIGGLNGLGMELFGQSFNDLCAQARAQRPPGNRGGMQPPPDGQLPADSPRYYLFSTVVELLAQICTGSGYHLVLAEAGFGKTALMSFLSRQPRPAAASYSFTRVDGRRSVYLALESLREQLQSLGNLTSAHHYSFAELIAMVAARIQPWSPARRRSEPQILILIDGIDECDHSERGLFYALLPAELPDNVAVVVTMRPTVRHVIAAHFAPSHPLAQSPRAHTLPPLYVADIQRLLLERHHIYAELPLCQQIAQISAGHPAAVFFLCRHIEGAITTGQEPAKALQNIPPLHTFSDLFAHELDLMRHLCGSEREHELLHRILGALVIARKPLVPAQLAEVLDAPPAAIEALTQRLDRFRRPMSDGSLALSHPQFVEYLQEHEDWQETLADLRTRWGAWITRQQVAPPLAADFIARVQEHLAPALSAYARAGQLGWDTLFAPAIRSREDWLAAITQAWDVAELTAQQWEREVNPRSTDRVDVAPLRQLLTKHFNISELKTLCFDLGIDYDDLPGQAKLDKARELVAYAQRHSITVELLRVCQHLRANVSWPRVASPAAPESALASAGPHGAAPEELLVYALLITSWPQGQDALLPVGGQSPDEQFRLVLTDQLRDSTEPVGHVESRDVEMLMCMLAGDAASTEPFVILVSELGQSWQTQSAHPQQQFAQILRLITQFVRRQATVSPLLSPRANLLDALSALAPAIRYHFPGSVERICQLVDTVIDVFP